MKINMDVLNDRKRNEIEKSMRAQNFIEDHFSEIFIFSIRNKIEEDQVMRRSLLREK